MTESNEVAELPPALIKQFAEMVTIVPDYEPGGAEGIIEAILNAKTLGDIDSPWSGGRQLPTERLLYFKGISKSLSEHKGGLPFFLVVDTFLPGSGEVKEYTTGATAVVAQLVRALTLDEFPFAATVIEVPLKRDPGQKSQHLRMEADDTARMRKEISAKVAK